MYLDKSSFKNSYDYSVLNANSKYIVETKDSLKVRQFKFLNQTESSIIRLKENKEMIIDKNNEKMYFENNS